jgi:hypothetical protein
VFRFEDRSNIIVPITAKKSSIQSRQDDHATMRAKGMVRKWKGKIPKHFAELLNRLGSLRMKIWRYGDMAIWRYGDMAIWRYVRLKTGPRLETLIVAEVVAQFIGRAQIANKLTEDQILASQLDGMHGNGIFRRAIAITAYFSREFFNWPVSYRYSENDSFPNPILDFDF